MERLVFLENERKQFLILRSTQKYSMTQLSSEVETISLDSLKGIFLRLIVSSSEPLGSWP